MLRTAEPVFEGTKLNSFTNKWSCAMRIASLGEDIAFVLSGSVFDSASEANHGAVRACQHFNYTDSWPNLCERF